MIIPMIKKETKDDMMVESLIALRRFELTGDRSFFRDWLKRWKKELDICKVAEGGQHDSLDEGIE